MGIETFSYEGKRSLVIGAATGIGAAVARLLVELGSEVLAMDFATITDDSMKSAQIDLRDQASIETAIAETSGVFDAVFLCAGVAEGTPGKQSVNFLGPRHVIELLLRRGQIGRGSAIGLISSVGGIGWHTQLDMLTGYLDTPDMDAGVAWIEQHADRDTYILSKQAVSAYVGREALNLLKHGIRINAIQPGPTDTSLARANADRWLGFNAGYRTEAAIDAATSDQQAYPLVYLCSDAATYVTGVNLVVDAGYVSSALTGRVDATAVNALMGRGG